jgi:hypothetical protein
MKNIDIHRALKKVLKMTYNTVLIDFTLEPDRVEWFYAGQFKHDPSMQWHPRIISYYPRAGKIAIRTVIGDPEPLYVNAEVLLKMATFNDPSDFRKDGA